MKIQKTELAQKLNKIKGVVPKKTTMPVGGRCRPERSLIWLNIMIIFNIMKILLKSMS